MTDYSKLVEALRSASAVSTAWEKLMLDAAAAIEDLQARLGEAENSVERWKDMYLTKHEPKRSKWIVHTEVKNIYGGICVECPVCGDHFVVLNVSDEKYCRSCGARMEVQDGDD